MSSLKLELTLFRVLIRTSSYVNNLNYFLGVMLDTQRNLYLALCLTLANYAQAIGVGNKREKILCP